MLKYDSDIESFRLVSDFPEFSFGNRRAQLSPLIRSLLWSLLSKLAESVNPRVQVWLRAFATNLYFSKVSQSRISFSETTARDNVQLGGADDLWLFDVPKTDSHLKFLETLVKSQTVNFHAYVFDLIPLETEKESGERRPESDRDFYARYIRLVAGANSLLFLSQFTRTRFFEYCRRKSLPVPRETRVQYPPWDYHFGKVRNGWSEQQELPYRARQFFATLGHSPLLLSIAPMTARKNLVVVFKAFARIARRDSTVRLLVITPILSQLDPETVWRAVRLSVEYPRRVLFVTGVSDQFLAEAYRRSSITLIPSRLEGFGLPIVEALHFGSQVIASDSGVFTELAFTLPIKLLPAQEDPMWERTIAESLSNDSRKSIPGDSVLPSSADFGAEVRKMSVSSNSDN